MSSRGTLLSRAVLTLLFLCAVQMLAQNPQNPGIFQKYSAPPSSTLGFFASDSGKRLLLRSPSSIALELLKRFHPDAVGQYPQKPQFAPVQTKDVHPNSVRSSATVTGCGTLTGTRMNLEPATNAVTQKAPSVDFFLNELGSGEDLVVEHGTDNRGEFGIFDSLTAVYVHRDGTVSCYGGTDFEMANPPIQNPFSNADLLPGVGGARVVADPSSRRQFIVADLRMDSLTSGVGLRRIPVTNLETVGTCPAGTLNQTQEKTCAGSLAIIVDASLDDMADSASVVQDPRTSGTGAGDVYVVNTSFGRFGSVIHLTVCKATFASNADCSTPMIVSGIQNQTQFPSIAVIGGGPNAGSITITYIDTPQNIEFVSCTPKGAPAQPTCTQPSLIYSDPNMISSFASLSDNPSVEINTWPVIADRTDSNGQTMFVAWSDCKISPYLFPTTACPNAINRLASATNLAKPSWALGYVVGATYHEFMPAIAYDAGQNIVTVAYYATGTDAYKNRVIVLARQILPGTISPCCAFYFTGTYDSIEGDGNFAGFGNPLGDYIGLAAHGGLAMGSSRAYAGFTSNVRLGSYSGVTNTQADNNISRATY